MTRPGVWSTGARRSFATRSLSARTQTLFESDVGYLRSIARPLAKAVQPEPQGIVQKFMAAWRIFFPERPNDSTPKEEGKNRLRMILVADRCGEGGFVGVHCVGGLRTHCLGLACSLARFLDPRRCGITPASLSHMRESIVKAVSDYVDIETEEEIEVCAVTVVRRLAGQGCKLYGDCFSSSASPLCRLTLSATKTLCLHRAQVNLSTDPELGTIYSVAVPVKRVKPSRVASRDGQRAERPAIAKVRHDGLKACHVHKNKTRWNGVGQHF